MTPILLSFSDSIANNYTPSASDLSTSLLFETKRSTKKQGKMFRINAAWILLHTLICIKT